MESPTTPSPDLSGGIAGNAIASCLALGAFVTAVIAGLAAGAEPIGVLWRAMISMVVCYVLGLVIGSVGMTAVREHIEQHVRSNPIEPPPDAQAASGDPDPEQGKPEDAQAA